MAVKPWIGAVKEPRSHPPANPSPPDVRFKLEYVYGYRSEDSRQNVFYNAKGEAVYMTAALGVILNHQTNT
jgi:microtubule-associated protein-like 6